MLIIISSCLRIIEFGEYQATYNRKVVDYVSLVLEAFHHTLNCVWLVKPCLAFHIPSTNTITTIYIVVSEAISISEWSTF